MCRPSEIRSWQWRATRPFLAAAALLIDYVLTVAVSIAVGAQQITSFVPALTPHPEALCLTANTAYADFPRLSAILAQDGFASRQLARLGDRSGVPRRCG
jgi:hypothetical protein